MESIILNLLNLTGEERAAFAPAYLIESPWDMIRILSGKAEENH